MKRTFKSLRRSIRPFERKYALLFFVLWNWRKRSDQVFRGAWRIVDQPHLKRRPKDRFGVPMRNIRHFQLRQFVKLLDPTFSPALRFDDEFLRTAFTTPGVVACVHSQTEFAICAALDQVGVRTAFVSSTAVSQKELENYKFAVPPVNLLRGPDLFVQARAAIKNGRTIVCDTDFILDKGLPGAKICISTSLFEFRRMLRLNLFFGHVRILEDGLDCIFEAHADGSTSAQEDAHSFIGFIERVSSPSTKLTIETWHSSDTQIGAARRQ